MKHIAFDLKRTLSKTRKTERGEMMRYFVSRLNPGRAADGLLLITMARMGKILEKIPTKDLYYLKSVCDRAPNFSKRFWYELDPQKYQERQAAGARASTPPKRAMKKQKSTLEP